MSAIQAGCPRCFGGNFWTSAAGTEECEDCRPPYSEKIVTRRRRVAVETKPEPEPKPGRPQEDEPEEEWWPEPKQLEPEPNLEPSPEPEPNTVPLFPGEEPPEPKQLALLDVPPVWEDQWAGMPKFEQKDLESFQKIYVHFRDVSDRRDFAKLVGQQLSDLTRSIWYPKAEIGHFAGKAFATTSAVNPRFPVYIISKGRWETRLTAKSLEQIGVPYHIVVEPQERGAYAAVIDPSKILVLPFSNLGQGSIPARNWVWEHALATGAERHWILDDNINGFFRLFDNLKTPVATGATFRAAEEFADRYTNVALAGFNYFMFACRKSGAIPPFVLNTRIYSCILIDNALPFRWRGRYNEDTDLSLRVLKDGRCTVLFNAFLALKQTTMTMGGGNTDDLYQGDGRLKMAESLREQHPDCVEIGHKWGRAQYQVDYRRFRKNRLVPRSGAVIALEPNNFGMELKQAIADNVVDSSAKHGPAAGAQLL